MVNRNTHSNKLQQMKDEILLLREELDRARLETKLLSSESKSSICSGDNGPQVQGSCGAEGVGSEVVRDTRQHLEELEECLNQCQLQVVSYSRCLSMVRGLLEQVVGRGEGLERKEGKALSEGEKEVLQECLRLLATCGNSSKDILYSDPPSSNNSDTISQLHSELEQCRMDLQTDELAFAEKGEEFAELQLVCDILVREKERLEGMWVAAQESEAALQTRVEQLTGRLAALEGGGAGESVMGGEEGSPSVIEEPSVAEDSLSEGAASVSGEELRFMATRSLLQGKVKTNSLEV